MANRLTANRRSKTLGQHEEAFKSRNGYVVEPPPDTSNEIGSVIAEFMQFKKLTREEIREGGRHIRKMGGLKIPSNQVARFIYNAIGYNDYADAVKQNQGKDYFENLNFGRRDLIGINQNVCEADQQVKEHIADFIRPYMDMISVLNKNLKFHQTLRISHE